MTGLGLNGFSHIKTSNLDSEEMPGSFLIVRDVGVGSVLQGRDCTAGRTAPGMSPYYLPACHGEKAWGHQGSMAPPSTGSPVLQPQRGEWGWAEDGGPLFYF